jgi:uncharacterized protein YfaP (DUF2135 family)
MDHLPKNQVLDAVGKGIARLIGENLRSRIFNKVKFLEIVVVGENAPDFLSTAGMSNNPHLYTTGTQTVEVIEWQD